MNTRLFLSISEPNLNGEDSIEFFGEEEWNEETDAKLLRTLQELLTVLRPNGRSLKIDLTVKADDPRRLVSLISRKQREKKQVHHQVLSSRELEVLSLIMQGYTNNKIAERLFISFETVKSHRKNILTKTGASNTAMLINYYHQTFFDDKE